MTFRGLKSYDIYYIMSSVSQNQINAGAKAICFAINTALENDDGALIGRNGTIELECMIYSRTSSALENNAGIFPLSTADKWRTASIKATQSANVLVTGWYDPLKEAEAVALNTWGATPIQIPLRSLEPYYVESSMRWTRLLAGHRVAVVSSFTETAKVQVKNMAAIWPNTYMFPSDIEWSWIQTGHPPSVAQGRNEWPPHVTSWSDAVNHVVLEVIRSGARFALLGCGGLSMPIAKELKDRGIITLVLGGAIQVLFGIKGKRWAGHPFISKLWNQAWVWPSPNETPAGALGVEGGCYWQG